MKPLDTDTSPPADGGATPAHREPDAATPPELTPEQRARRTLLKLAVYVPPAVIGSLVVGRSAYAGTFSCAPGVCDPNCGPSQCKPRP